MPTEDTPQGKWKQLFSGEGTGNTPENKAIKLRWTPVTTPYLDALTWSRRCVWKVEVHGCGTTLNMVVLGKKGTVRKAKIVIVFCIARKIYTKNGLVRGVHYFVYILRFYSCRPPCTQILKPYAQQLYLLPFSYNIL